VARLEDGGEGRASRANTIAHSKHQMPATACHADEHGRVKEAGLTRRTESFAKTKYG